MLNPLLDKIPELKKNWHDYEHLFAETCVAARTVLLREGQVPDKIFIVEEGCLCASISSRGKEIAFQFFFENDMIASIDSFRTGRPSPITIKSIEPSKLLVLSRQGFETLVRDIPSMKDFLLEIAFKRFGDYAQLFISYLRNSPRQRYLDLLKEHPSIVQRIPQHYIASYLGITPVSLSRIRRRI